MASFIPYARYEQGSAYVEGSFNQSIPGITVNSSGLITATVAQKSVEVTPTIVEGWIRTGDSNNITLNSNSNTKQLSTQGAKTVTPSESPQTAVSSGVYTTGAITVGAISSTYVGSGVSKQAAKTVTPSTSAQTAVASGVYTTGAITVDAMPIGSATTPATTKQQSQPTFSRSGNIITASVAATSVSVTPTVSAGYVSNGTAGTITMSANSNTYTILTQDKTATANGIFYPDSGYLLNSVTVSIPSYTKLI